MSIQFRISLVSDREKYINHRLAEVMAGVVDKEWENGAPPGLHDSIAMDPHLGLTFSINPCFRGKDSWR